MNLNVKDAARLLSVSEKTIYRWIKQDIVPAYKVHESYRFNRAELLEWATARRRGVAGDAYEEPEADDQPLPSLTDALETGGVFYRVEGKTREEVLTDAVGHLRVPEDIDLGHLTQMLITREQLAPTATGSGIAIPHPRSPGLLNVLRPTVTLCFLEEPVDFHALDGQPVSILFMIIAPNLRSHLHLLSRLSFVLHNSDFRDTLLQEGSREKIFAALTQAESFIKTN
ncbi:PTS sugar transporter subunit IIA [Geopsychrobacter electrodiphilus]|uniref:PTS sugar transporter subunit IIA n=1 Tax=Geopsychrobacter electrodiphilus TaxID=225196 RepID=UPI0003722BA4|nr:PTS sugar transporter subunit IIA [Geopsychrobacter electrodiphilus]